VTEGGGGANRLGPTAGEVRGDSLPGPRSCDGGVVARHGWGVGDHGSRVNLAGGRLGWPVHGEVACAHGGGDRR
jgi:hypothetical protein